MEKKPLFSFGAALFVLDGKSDGLLLSGWADLDTGGLRDCLWLTALDGYCTTAGVMLCLRDSALADFGLIEALWEGLADGLADGLTEASLDPMAEFLGEGAFWMAGITGYGAFLIALLLTFFATFLTGAFFFLASTIF